MKFPAIKGRLTPALSLAEDYERLQKAKENYSLQLVAAAITDAQKKIKDLPLNQIVNRRLLKKCLSFLSSSIVLCFLYYALFPRSFAFAFYTLFFPDKIPIEIISEPKEVFTLPDKEVKLNIRIVSPYIIKSGNLFLRELSGEQREVRYKLKFQKNFTEYKFYPQKEVAYYISLLNRSSSIGFIRFIYPLELLSLNCLIIPPSYTSLPPSRIEFPKEISCLKGSEIRVTARSNISCQWSVLRESLTEGDSFAFSFKALGDTLISLRLTAAQGNEKVYPIKINYIPDENPFVRFLLPGRDMDIPETMKILLLLYGLDDFGIKEISIFAQRKTDSGEQTKVYWQRSVKKSDTLTFIWDLTKWRLLPGDEINYHAVIYDNDPYGPKFSKSPEYKLRFPTLTEIYSQTVEKREEIKSSLSSQLRESEKVSEDIENIIANLKRERKLSWEEKKALASTLGKKEEILSVLKKLREEVKATMEELLQSAAYDRETMEKLEELETLLAQILPQELKEAIAKLREALTQKKEDLAPILQKMKLTSDELKKQLARAIEILKRLQEEAKLKELEKKLTEIEKEQKDIEGDFNKIAQEKLAEREKAIVEALKSWEKELKELNLSDKEFQEEMERIKKELEKEPFSKIAEGIKEKIEGGKVGEAKKLAEGLRRQLSKLRQRLRELTQGMKKRQKQEFVEKLQRYALTLCDITEYTEELERKTERRKDEKELIDRSRGIAEGVKNVADSIIALAQRYLPISPRLADDLFKAISALEEAGNFLFEKNYQGGETKISEAKMEINNTIEGILLLLTLSQKGGMAGGMESFLNALSQGLKEMSDLLSEMGSLPIPLPTPLSGEELANIQRLLGRQRSLRERLEEMIKGLSDKPGLTSSMEGVIEEMKKIEEDMEKLNITRELVQRQEKVFQRLLDVERSLQKKETEEKRESEVGKEFKIEERPVLSKDLGERKRILQEELLKALQENYPREYYRLIKEYFDALLYEE